MENTALSFSPAVAEAPIEAEDFYGSSFTDIPATLPPAAAPATPTPPATPPSVAAPTTEPATPAAEVDDTDDLFEKPAAAPVAGAPATPTAAAPTETAPAQPDTPAPAGADTPWKVLITKLALPETATPDDVEGVIQQRAQQLIERQKDPVATQLSQIEAALAVTDNKAFMSQMLRFKAQTEDGFVDEDSIADEVDSYETKGTLVARADAIRSKLNGQKTTLTAQQQQSQAQQAQAQKQMRETADAYRGQLKKTVADFRNESNQPLTPEVQKQLTEDYMFSGDLLKDLDARVNSDPAFVFELAKLLHPTYGPKFQKMANRMAAKTGASDVWKQIEGGTPRIGASTELPDNGPVVIDADNYYN